MIHPRLRLGLATLACALAVSVSGPALADNYTAKDGNGLFITFAAKLFSGFLHPFHIAEGQVGGTGSPQPLNVDTSGNLGVNPNAFTPTGNTVSLTAGTTSSSVAINAGPTEVITNNGTTTADIVFGTSSVVATTSGYPILAGQTQVFSTTAGYIAAITASGSDTLTISPGVGSPVVNETGAVLGLQASVNGATPAGTSHIGSVAVDDSGGTAATDTTAHAVKTISSGSALNTAQVSVTTTAAVIVASRTGRQSVSIENTSTTDVWLGPSGVTTSTGMLLPGTKGASITLPGSEAIYGIVGSGTDTVSYIETY